MSVSNEAVKVACSFPGCMRARKYREVCSSHYNQVRAGREMTAIKSPRRPPNERFFEAIDRSGSCWGWTRYKNSYGYGVFSVDGKSCLAHRWAYASLVEPIPAGVTVDHICHNRSCVNPDHLRLATVKQNIENREGAQSNSRTGVRGISIARNGKFIARVKHHGKRVIVGTFADLEDAERAVIACRNDLFTHNIRDRARAAALRGQG